MFVVKGFFGSFFLIGFIRDRVLLKPGYPLKASLLIYETHKHTFMYVLCIIYVVIYLYTLNQDSKILFKVLLLLLFLFQG